MIVTCIIDRDRNAILEAKVGEREEWEAQEGGSRTPATGWRTTSWKQEE